MIVLLDLEWIEENGNHLTQLSAVRTDENWTILDRWDSFVNSGISYLKDRNHIALGGYDTDIFENGVSVEECVSGFAHWLQEDDIILVWARSNLLFFLWLWGQYMNKPAPKVICTAKKARKAAGGEHSCTQTPYSMLANMGEEIPQPEHRSTNDVEVMRQVLSRLDISCRYFEKGCQDNTEAKPTITQRERNRELIANSQYNFLYIKGSDVFHRRDCKVCLNAGNHADILGSVYYDTAANNHRPCKICNPIPLPLDAEKTDKERERREKAEIEKTENARLKTYSKEIIRTKMLTGEVVPICRGHVLGWCHHSMHPGAISKTIMDEHDCLGKNCHFLEKNSLSPYWNAYAEQKRIKEKRKEKIREEKRKKALEEQDLFAIMNQWQSYLTDMDYDMKIVRVAKESNHEYNIFYVSDNCFADGNKYPLFLSALKKRYPHSRICLRHIRDIDGHFVTRNEYQNRRRK